MAKAALLFFGMKKQCDKFSFADKQKHMAERMMGLPPPRQRCRQVSNITATCGLPHNCITIANCAMALIHPL